ncbi:DUF1295 domain-containing protein [Gammaproteobacteria bacterium]|nr:DUF1295 domain-containing protein [Gammaproteobacteria bacterium]|tara:strand:- start:2722 stop:3597 length:876 start_codon:yes stop_codon:yes gene_type:complete
MKKLSLLLVCLWYLLALLISFRVTELIGILGNIWLKILIAHVIATIVIYVGSVIHNNSSLYDPFWSIAPVPIIIFLYTLSDINNLSTLNKILISAPIIFWSLRLTRNWIISWDGFSHEDFRYIELKKGGKIKLEFINFTGIHLIPTLQVNLSLFPLYFLFNSYELSSLNYPLIFASIFTILAVIIETIADEQMRSFRSNKKNEGITMNKGLWKYSRHPNYFGEVMFWVGLYLMAFLSIKTPFWLILSPISMIILFIFISCPMMDNRSLKKRSDYKQYMNNTSQLFIWFPKI